MNRCPDAAARGESSAEGTRPTEGPRGVLVALVLVGPLSGCSTPSTSFELDVVAAVASKAAWYEVGVFPDGCPAPSLLLGGIPAEGTVARLAWGATGPAPALGTIPSGTFGVGAVARAADCSVVATGCSSASVSGGVTVALAAVSGTPAGACEAGSVCLDAACLPSADAAALDPAAACSMTLVGQGPLADPLDPNMTLLSAPAIAATPSGFLIAYREFDPNAASGSDAARLTTIALDLNGGASAPSRTMLPGSCIGAPETDATALTFGLSAGTIAVSRPPCTDGGAGGIDTLSVGPGGDVLGSAFSGHSGLVLTLGQGHALATTVSGVILAYTNASAGAAFANSITSGGLASSPAASFASLTGIEASSAYVVGTEIGTGFLALGLAPNDAGVDGGGVAGIATFTADAGDAAASAGARFAAAWVSASGVGNRILVASNDPASSASIRWSAFDIGASSAAAPTGSFSAMSRNDVSFADVAVHQDHAFFAAEVADDISLFAFDKASTNPIELLEVVFSSMPVIPIGALRDGLVAVAASDTRVAVVWGTGKILGADDAVGGYAVFSCATVDPPDADLSP